MKWTFLSAAVLLGTIPSTQQVTYQQKQAYLQKLLHLQSEINDNVHIIRGIAQRTLTNSQLLQGQPDLQKTILHQAIKMERHQLESTLQQTLIPLKENYWTCKNLSNFQKDLIAAKIRDLKAKTDSINKQINGDYDCTRNVQLKSQLRFLKLHIQSLENQLSNTCQPPRKNDKFVNNLDTSQNWIYGSLTPQDYQRQIQNWQNQYNLIQCNENEPFLINEKCSNCPKAQQKFSLSQKKCIEQCPAGTVFLKLNHNCVDPTSKVLIPQNLDNVDSSTNPYVWGPTNQQNYKDQIQQLRDNKVPLEQCPSDKPFNQNGQKCTSCSQGEVFNIGTKQCTRCNIEQRYVQRIHECKQVYKRPNYGSGNNWIAVNGDSQPIDNKLKDLQSQNYPVEECPSDKPFPTKDLKTCVACDKNYNLISGSCQECSKYFAVESGSHQCTYVIKNCGTNQFWNGQTCLKCIQPGIYDKILRKCTCNQPQKYDPQTGTCMPGAQNQKNPNPSNADNFVGTPPLYSKFIDDCPDSKPFYDSSLTQCIECVLPTKYYDYNQDKCSECDKNLQFSVEQKKCVQAVYFMNSNIGPNINNYCCGQPSKIQGKQSCPEDSPFFDGYHCLSCSKPQYFDFKEKQCKSCPTGKDFSQIKKQCIDEALLKPKIVSNIPSGTTNYYGTVPSDHPDSEGQKVTKCPQDKPFSNGNECISCEKPRYFNFQSNQCEICKDGYSFSGDSKECQRNTLVGKDIYNSNMVNAENFVGRIPDYKNQYPQCPSDKRYFNGAECEKCQLPYFWNFDKNDCRQCNKGLYFDKQARQCLYEPGQQKYKTNILETKNIYYNGDFEEVRREVQSSGKTACPADKPFFDKSSNVCINCSGGWYIFNFAKNHCMRCPDGTHFNQDYHICFQNGVGPTIQRMVMNSVSWI